MGKGLLISFEGIDYAGKDTQAEKTRNWLGDLGYLVGYSNEPNDNEFGGSPLGHTIRKMLQGKIAKPEDLFEFQRMYVLDRGQDIFCFIRPVLDNGDVYVIIRYGFSTIAYGMLSGNPPEKFIQLHKDVLGPSLIWPDVTVLIDISGEESARRLAKAKNKPEFFEQKREGLEKVRQSYLQLAKHPEFSKSIVVVNGERSVEEIFEDIKKIIFPKLPPKKLPFSR